MKNNRIELFKIKVGDAERKKALTYKRFIYKTLKDCEDGVKYDTETDLEIKIDLIYAIRYIYCVELGFNPEGVKIDFVDDMSIISGKKGSIAISRILKDLEKDHEKYFAEVVFSSSNVASRRMTTFTFIVAHEMHHVYQKVLRAYGKFAFAGDNKIPRYGTDLEKSWCELLYDISLCELDANVGSLQNILKWLEEVESLGLEDVGGLDMFKTNTKRCQREFAKRYMGSVAKTGGFLLVNWLSLIVYGTMDIFEYDLRMGFCNSEKIYKRNVKNLLNGSRTIKSANKTMKKIKEKNELYVLDKTRYCDAMVVLLANKYGINPLALGLMFARDSSKGVQFIDCMGKNESKLLGCIKINVDYIEDLGTKEFIITINDLMRKVEKDKNFLKAVERYKLEKRCKDKGNGELGEE